MKTLGIVLALVVASLGSIGCTASSDDGQEEAAQTEDELRVGGGSTSLTCHRFPTDTCVSVGTYCRNHGGQLVCDLYGNCTCVYPALGRAY